MRFLKWPVTKCGVGNLKTMLPLLLACAVIIGTASRSMAAELIFFHATGCPYCEAWEEEVGSIYHKTAEAGELPLRRIDISDRLPPDIKAMTEAKTLKPVMFTPTFVVMEDNREIGRIMGYQADFFWPMLHALMEKTKQGAPKQTSQNGGS